MIPATTAMTCSFIEYAMPGKWLSRRNLILLSIVPIMDLILTLTNGSHHLLWNATIINESVVPIGNWLGWVFVGYGNLLGLVNIAIFIWLLFHGPENRWPILFMLIGNILGRILYLATFIDQSPLLAGLPIESVPFLAYSIALFGFQIFAPIPLARLSAVNHLQAGVVIMDDQENIVYLNPAAERLSKDNIEILKTESIRQFAQEDQKDYSELSKTFEILLSCENHKVKRCFNIAVSKMPDWRGISVGKLIMINDITEQKEAQRKITEQQLVLAGYQEREILARELHDNICQVLSYAGFQLDAALKLNKDGKTEESITQLNHLGTIIRDSTSDLREQINNLQVIPCPERPFFETLQVFLNEFDANYNIQTDLEICDGIDNTAFLPKEQQQIIRIIQEGMSNIRKHGQVEQARIFFRAEDGSIKVIIQDDGVGFDPDHYNAAGNAHFGIKFMKARAEMIGGALTIHSSPETGTQVILNINRDK